MYIRPFHVQGNTVNISVLASSARVQVTTNPIGVRSMRITNNGSQVVFVNFGDSTVTASTSTSFPMLPNSVETFLLQNEVSYVAAIAGATGNTLYITPGEGA